MSEDFGRIATGVGTTFDAVTSVAGAVAGTTGVGTAMGQVYDTLSEAAFRSLEKSAAEIAGTYEQMAGEFEATSYEMAAAHSDRVASAVEARGRHEAELIRKQLHQITFGVLTGELDRRRELRGILATQSADNAANGLDNSGGSFIAFQRHTLSLAEQDIYRMKVAAGQYVNKLVADAQTAEIDANLQAADQRVQSAALRTQAAQSRALAGVRRSATLLNYHSRQARRGVSPKVWTTIDQWTAPTRSLRPSYKQTGGISYPGGSFSADY